MAYKYHICCETDSNDGNFGRNYRENQWSKRWLTYKEYQIIGEKWRQVETDANIEQL